MSKRVFIASAARTAIGSFNGSISDVSAVDLGITAVKGALERANMSDKTNLISETNLGCVYQAGLGQGAARQIAIGSGIPNTAAAVTTNILCGSGLFSVVQGARSIVCGDTSAFVAGGIENMSSSPYILPKGRNGFRMGHGEVLDTMIKDGLTDAFNDYHMGMTAENLADKYSISREEQDQFAFESQAKATKADNDGLFKDEIVPVIFKKRRKEVIFDQDEYIKKDCTIESLQKLRPAFKKDGTVTAGNASGINDGAAAVVIVDEDTLKSLGLTPLAEITGWGVSGCDPAIMGIGPVDAVKKALKMSGSSVSDIDLIEANEAFSAQAISVNKELGWDTNKVNVNGGAIALGHPVGASGARILTTLLFEMKRREVVNGLATLCVGGGMGIALQVKRA
ncbi:MAG: acetyl-CoA C-acetyltransferase [Candidatus Cloacimonetes bacterium]|nr:acetyl-CoA C-acetyltransferase [Candidatus Cloacimonadota bacterium]